MLKSLMKACAQKLFGVAIMVALTPALLASHELILSGVGVESVRAHEKSQSFSKWRSTENKIQYLKIKGHHKVAWLEQCGK